MGFDSIWHWLILLVVVLVIFGTGKLTRIGPDLGKAMRDFKKALHGDDATDEAGKTSEEQLKADPPDSAHASTHKPHESSEPK